MIEVGMLNAAIAAGLSLAEAWFCGLSVLLGTNGKSHDAIEWSVPEPQENDPALAGRVSGLVCQKRQSSRRG